MEIKVDTKKVSKNQEKEYLKAMQDEKFKGLVKKIKISEEEAKKNVVKLNDTLEELSHCQKCKGLYECQNKVNGYVYFPIESESSLSFSYRPCKYQKEAQKEINNKSTSEKLIENARLKDIKITKNRTEIIKWLKNFYDNYNPYGFNKGLYLHGNFGTGKTFLIAALLNEIKLKYKVRVEIVYVPELLRKLKENLNAVGDNLNVLENADILLLDDIGAEKVTEWGRDEIIGTILQTRMNKGLTTFFTSNLNMDELMQTLSLTKEREDAVKAKRIMERIKYLTYDIELLGNNYREEKEK